MNEELNYNEELIPAGENIPMEEEETTVEQPIGPVEDAEIKATYVKKSIPGHFIGFPDEIDAEYWAGQIGTTYEDYLADKWILLTEEQVKFHEENPYATVEQVLKMQLAPEYVRTLEDAKREMISIITRYDNSENVDSFTINDSVTAWFTPTERSNYKNSIDAAKLLGIEQLSLFVGDMAITVPTINAEQMLAAIQLYADACFIVTKQHKVAVENLDSIEEVDNYDYKSGYPLKLNFNINN